MKLLRLHLWLMVLLAGSAQAAVRMSNVFSDHMVLQREQPVTVWGTAASSEVVTVRLAGQTATATSDQSGKWQIHLKPLPAGGPHELIVSGQNTLTFKNVLIGDIWICAGQSNMELTLGAVDMPATRSATNPKLRLLTIKSGQSNIPVNDVLNGWMECQPQTARSFSAAGYFFAKRILAETGVPIGLVDNSWGGTGIDLWLNTAELHHAPELDWLLQSHEKKAKVLNDQLLKHLDEVNRWLPLAQAAKLQGNPLPDAPKAPTGGGIGGIFNGRVAPLTRFPIKGVIWYQGEQDSKESDNYLAKQRALISGWRAAWNQGDFPFYFVQLPNFQEPPTTPAGGDGWAHLREAQRRAIRVPHTGMAVTIDIGDAASAHPLNKEDVGTRLALWALHYDYGQTNLVCSGPLYKDMTVEGNKVRISFDYAGHGLMVGKKVGNGPAQEDHAGKLQRFAIAGANKQWYWADAVIEGDTVLVSSPSVPQPVAVRYAFAMNPTGCNLYNRDGLPASPFRTDLWQTPTANK